MKKFLSVTSLSSERHESHEERKLFLNKVPRIWNVYPRSLIPHFLTTYFSNYYQLTICEWLECRVHNKKSWDENKKFDTKLCKHEAITHQLTLILSWKQVDSSSCHVYRAVVHLMVWLNGCHESLLILWLNDRLSNEAARDSEMMKKLFAFRRL